MSDSALSNGPANALLDRTSIHEIRNRIRIARAMSVADLSEDQIKGRLRMVLMGYSFNTVAAVTEGFYRARPNQGSKPFQKVAELWYPDPKYCTRLGRFNRIGQPAFYCSDQAQTAVFEIRPPERSWFTLLIAGPKAGGPISTSLLHLGLEHAKSPHLLNAKTTLARNNPKHLAILGRPGNYKKWLDIDDYLGDMATQIVEAGEEDRYKITIALREILSIDQFDGVAYPSIATHLNGMNICLRPERADALLQAASVSMAQVIGISNGVYVTSPLTTAKRILADGTIDW